MPKFYEDKFNSHFVEVNGLRLHYTDWGSENPPLVFVHGFNVQLHSWDPIADKLRDRYRVLCPDLRGHGDSDWSRAGYTVHDFVSDLHGVVTALDLPPFDLAGHSLGARIAIAYAAAYPDTVKHVVLSDAGPETSREGALRVRDQVTGAALEKRGFRNEEEVVEFFRSQNPDWQPHFHEIMGHYQVRRNWADKLVWKADPDMFWINGGMGLRETPFLWESCEKITAPTLVMMGETSWLLDQNIADRMIAAIPNATLEKFPTGHYIMREQPDLFTDSLHRFLAS